MEEGEEKNSRFEVKYSFYLPDSSISALQKGFSLNVDVYNTEVFSILKHDVLHAT